MSYGIIFILHLALSCLIGYFTHKIATDKGYYSAGYFWLGFFLGMIGIIIAACLTDQRQYDSPRYLASSEKPYYERSARERGVTSAWECGYCHQKNSKNLTYCTYCRRDKDIAQKDIHPEAAPQSITIQEEKPIVRICPECAAENINNAKFCKSCGNPMSKDESWFCPSCNTKNEEDALFCVQCGVKREG